MTFLLLFYLLKVLLVKGDSIVQTENGPVRGLNVASDKVVAFLGIPYAEPPLGSLRFDKPVRKGFWKEIYNATELPVACIQPYRSTVNPDITQMSEDCLYLNIWVPQSNNTNAQKTVMLFIHGGSFITGSSMEKLFDGMNISEYGDVIVVTINYRVGALGFFAGFTEDAPGSIGLYDQVMAIQWIKENAKHFGGDSDNIVLFGQSAGAFSISMHQISPLSKNLFKRAILESGSSVNPLYTDKNRMVHKLSQAYAELLECSKDGRTLDSHPRDIIDCLRVLPAELYSEADTEILNMSKLLYPRIGNDFLPKNPIDLYQEGYFNEGEVMLLIIKNEGTVFPSPSPLDLDNFLKIKNIDMKFNESMAYLFMKLMLGNSFQLEENDIFQRYLSFVNNETGYTYLNAASDAIGDYIINCGSIFQAEYQSMRGIPVYYSMFYYRTEASPFPEWSGVAHGDEQQYVFNNPENGLFTEYEEQLSKYMMSIWTTFAKTGDPNVAGGVTWPKYTSEDPKYFIFGKPDNESVDTRPDDYRCENWRNLFSSSMDEDVMISMK